MFSFFSSGKKRIVECSSLPRQQEDSTWKLLPYHHIITNFFHCIMNRCFQIDAPFNELKCHECKFSFTSTNFDFSNERYHFYLFHRRNMRLALKKMLTSHLTDDSLIIHLENQLWLQSPTLAEYFNPLTLRDKLLKIIEETSRQYSQSMAWNITTEISHPC